MEANNNGGHGSSYWSYREEISGSNGTSSRSGTIVSTLYTSSTSRHSNFSMEMEAGMHLDSMGIHKEEEHYGNNVVEDDDNTYHQEAKERIQHITSLVQEFSIAPSANCSIKAGDMCVVERWLTELGVAWVLSLDDDDDVASAGEKLSHDARSWTRALHEIAGTICFVSPLFPDRASTGLPSICHEERDHMGEVCTPDRYHLVLFIQGIILKMLTFVDAIVAWDPYYTMGGFLSDRMTAASYNKLIALLGVHDALFKASTEILRAFHSSNSVQVQRIENEMIILLSANKSNVGEAIRSTLEEIRTKSMEDGDESSSSLNPQGSSDSHKVTRSLRTYLSFLSTNYKSVDAAIPGNYVLNVSPVDRMIIETVSCLEEKLANISDSCPNQCLKFFFLLNNSCDIKEQIQGIYFSSLKRPAILALDLPHKIEGHVQRYVQVSWALLMSCLLNTAPRYLGKNSSPLSKFETEFQKMYTTQKYWKVPVPWLRKRVRTVITAKIIPRYTKYLEKNKVANPKFTPNKLKEMLQELFEG